MRIKLGTHHNAITRFDRMIEFARLTQPPVVKLLDIDLGYVQAVRTVSPSSLIIGRDAHNVYLLTNPRAAAKHKLARLKARADWDVIDIWEGNNEPDTYNWDVFTTYAVFEKHLADLLHQEGKQYVALSWGEGHPPLYGEETAFPWRNFIEHYEPVLERADFLGLHEYGFPRMNSPGMVGFHVLRFPRWYEQLPPHLRKPIIITECGLTNAVGGLGPDVGYKEWLSDEEYVNDIIWYGQALNLYSYVIGFCPFCDGTRDSAWDPFDWTEAVVNRLIAYQTSGEPELPDWITDLRAEAVEHTGRTIARHVGTLVHHTGNPDAPVQNQIDYAKRHACYHFLIDQQGTAYYMRDISEVVWHAGDGPEGVWNGGGIAITFIGSFMGYCPSDHAFASFRRLRRWLIDVMGIFPTVKGHKDIRLTTACPGDWYPDLRYKLLEEGGQSELDRLRKHIAELEILLKDKDALIGRQRSTIAAVIDAVTRWT